MADIDDLREACFDVLEPDSAQKVFDEIWTRFSGTSAYFSKKEKINEFIEIRNKDICISYNGRNMRQVCQKFNLCQRQVQVIVKSGMEKKPACPCTLR